MENLITRYLSLHILAVVLAAQVIGLAIQVKRTTDTESTRLIRIWAVSAVVPFERGLSATRRGVANVWSNYLYLRGVREENRQLKQEIERLRLEQVRLNQDASQARRLQALLNFKEQYVAQTVVAQVIGGSGSEQSRSIYIDKGEKEHLEPDMAVITSAGVVGKVLKVYPSSSLVLLINDQSSGLGAILEKSRLQGVVRGSVAGETMLDHVMSDEEVAVGETIVTSGGDGIFPKGFAVGTVAEVKRGAEQFWSIRVRPAASLERLEEVLVITKKEEREAAPVETAGPVRAADILAARLPSVPVKAPIPVPPGKTGSATAAAPGAAKPLPTGSAPAAKKPASTAPPATTPPQPAPPQ
jgi:rod shape-determining protein MreC